MVPSEKVEAFYRSYHAYLKENGVDGVKVVSVLVGSLCRCWRCFGVRAEMSYGQLACFITLSFSLYLSLATVESILAKRLANALCATCSTLGSLLYYAIVICGRTLVRCVSRVPGCVRPVVRQVSSSIATTETSLST